MALLENGSKSRGVLTYAVFVLVPPTSLRAIKTFLLFRREKGKKINSHYRYAQLRGSKNQIKPESPNYMHII